VTVTTTAPPVKAHELRGRDGGTFHFSGRHLGSGSSDHPDKDRWFEVDLYVAEIAGERTYVVHTQGRSRVPGEVTRSRIAQTTSAFEVVELLTVNHGGKLYIPRQSSHALAQAAQWDDGIRDAYVNRAVV
jgi:hypothetical protein